MHALNKPDQQKKKAIQALLLYYLHHTGTPHHESTSLKLIAQLFKNCDNKFNSQVLGTSAQWIFSTAMSSWHFHNAFFVPFSICNQRVYLFFHPFICNFNTSTDKSHYKKTSCQTKQSVQIKTQCYQFRMIARSTPQTNTQLFFFSFFHTGKGTAFFASAGCLAQKML